MCSGFPPMGFSLNTAFPAAHAASIIGRCSMLGAVTQTTSTSSDAIASRQSATARSNPKSRTARSRRASSVSAHTTSTGSNERFGNSDGIRSMERLCPSPIQPRPNTATPIRRFIFSSFLCGPTPRSSANGGLVFGCSMFRESNGARGHRRTPSFCHHPDRPAH